MHIRMLVDAPKPLSIRDTGIVSSIIFGVAQRRTPADKPKRNRPTHMTLKLRTRERAVPTKATTLN